VSGRTTRPRPVPRPGSHGIGPRGIAGGAHDRTCSARAMIRRGADAERFAAERRDEQRVKGHDLGLPANLDAPPRGRRAADVDGSGSVVQPEGHGVDLRRARSGRRSRASSITVTLTCCRPGMPSRYPRPPPRRTVACRSCAAELVVQCTRARSHAGLSSPERGLRIGMARASGAAGWTVLLRAAQRWRGLLSRRAGLGWTGSQAVAAFQPG
jgi:hypothetical protein